MGLWDRTVAFLLSWWNVLCVLWARRFYVRAVLTFLALPLGVAGALVLFWTLFGLAFGLLVRYWAEIAIFVGGPVLLFAWLATRKKKAPATDIPDNEVELEVVNQEADEAHDDMTLCVCNALVDVSESAPIRRPHDPQSIQTSRESQWRIEDSIAFHQFEVDTDGPLNSAVINQIWADLQNKVNRHAKAYALLIHNGHAPFVYAVKNGGNYLLIEVVLQTDQAMPKIEQRRRELIKRRQRSENADDRDF